MKTRLGKSWALAELVKRRRDNLMKEAPDNSKQVAGEPMTFLCVSCGDDIVVLEEYVNRPKLCAECQAMKDCGWLE